MQLRLFFLPLALMGALWGASLDLRVGIYQNAPKIFIDDKGQPSGFFPELLLAIAQQEGWVLHYIPCAWDECLRLLEAGELDIMPDVAHTPERQKHFLFGHEAVFSSWSVLYHRRNVPIESLLELQRRRIAVMRQSVQSEAIKRELNSFGVKAEYVEVAHFDDAFAQLSMGSVDCVLANRFYTVPKPYVDDAVRTNIMIQPATIRLAFAPGRQVLLERSDFWLKHLKADNASIFYSAYKRWLEPEPSAQLPMWIFWILVALLLLSALMALLFRRIALNRRVALAGALEEVERLIHHDDLTDLPNRFIFMDHIRQAINTYRHTQRSFAVVIFNLDNFREINEAMSHAAGDVTLRHVADTLRSILRQEDMVARFGGDEFALVLSGATSEMGLLRIMKEVSATFQTPFLIDRQPIYLTFSAGIALFPVHGEEMQSLLNNAISAMKKAKSEGKNSFVFFSPQMQDQLSERLLVVTRLREAIAVGGLTLYYQPKYEAQNGTLQGCEVLLRWFDERFAHVSPQETVTLAEEHGLIIPLGDFVLEQALKQQAQWEVEGLHPGMISINISALQLKETAFVERLEGLLTRLGVKGSQVELELTESQLMKNPAAAIEMLKRIHALGVGIAIDDFGTGYSSLSYLRALPITTLKIDRSFVSELPDDTQHANIARAVVALAKSMGLQTVAEGVETEAQAHFLREHGCDYLQGYLYAKPMSAEAMRILLEVHM